MASLDPRIKVHHIWGKMSIGQTPNHAKFCGDPTRSVRDIRDQNRAPEKVHQNSPKSLKTCYALKPASCQIPSRSVKPPWRKPLQNFVTPFNILATQGDPWAKGHWSVWLGTSTPSSYLQNSVLFHRPLYEISAAKLRRC